MVFEAQDITEIKLHRVATTVMNPIVWSYPYKDNSALGKYKQNPIAETIKIQMRKTSVCQVTLRADRPMRAWAPLPVSLINVMAAGA